MRKIFTPGDALPAVTTRRAQTGLLCSLQLRGDAGSNGARHHSLRTAYLAAARCFFDIKRGL